METLFPGATGQGMRVVVIDSGVNSRHPHISGVAGGAWIHGPGEIENGSFEDVLGHGTAVMAAIQEKAPAAEYYAAKIFHDRLRTNSLTLIAAIDWALEMHADAINLSLGTTNLNYASDFERTMGRAQAAGVTVVSAREANGVACLPGWVPGVIGVAPDQDCPRNRYRVARVNSGMVYLASPYPRTAPGIPVERNLNGISFAVANMTGFVLLVRETKPNEDLSAVLAAEVQDGLKIKETL